MRLEDFPLNMQADIKKLAAEHPITIYEAIEYYLMGGNLHGEELCKLKSMNVSDRDIKYYNAQRWEEYAKEKFKELSQYGKSPLEIAMMDFFTTIGEVSGLYKLADWLNEKLSKFK